ncbi:MAG: hypothetical protein L3K15_09530, partial [Thermoplasmata archaeon]|nr:hypothetical protein [Thermoplasmata archaeon]
GTTTAYGGGLQTSTNLFRGGNWYACDGWTCSGWFGVAPLTLLSAAAYDPIDGYTVLRGGIIANGLSSHAFKDTFVFGVFLSSPGPGVGPEYIDLGQSATFSAGASGGGTGSYRFQWNGVPAGCSPGTPGAATFSCAVTVPGFTLYSNYIVGYGSYYNPSVVITDTNGFPSITTSQFEWLYVARDAKVVGSASKLIADVGQTVTFNESAWDGWGPYTLGWAGVQPGCVVLSNTGYVEELSCKLTAASLGQFYLTALVTDNVGYTAQGSPLAVTVYPDPSATGVSTNTAALDAGQTLSIGVTPSGGTGSYTFAWSSVPAACTADAALLTCTVPPSEIGTYVPSVKVTDSNGVSVTETYSGSILVSAAPTAVGLSVVRGGSPTETSDAGQSVTFNLTSTGGSGGDTVAWAGLPSGCMPAANSVSVTCSPGIAGTYNVHASITDSNGETATAPGATLLVSPALSSVTLSASSTAPIVGGSLTLAAAVSGGSGANSYAWSGLPAGCAASNTPVVTCSPSATSATTVRVTVTDSNGGTSTGTVSIHVEAAPFASPFQEVELGLLVGLLVLLVLAVAVLLTRRRPPAATMVMTPTTPPPTPRVSPPGSTGPPPGPAGGAGPRVPTPKPEYIED